MNSNQPAPYCIAPWIHAHVAANGKRKLCCLAEESPYDVTTPIDDFYNTAYVKEARQQLLKGIVPLACAACRNKQTSLSNRKMYFNFLQTEDQYDQLGIISLDYRGDNTCNLRCRMCNPTSSSSIETIHSKAQATPLQNHQGLYKSHTFQEMVQVLGHGKVRAINFADGEPFISASHDKIIDFLISHKLASKIQLIYNTNLTVVLKRDRSILSRLHDEFKSVLLLVSMDGVGEKNDFLRDGARWSSFEKNLDHAIDIFGHNKVILNITITVLGLFDLDSIKSFIKKKRIAFELTNCLNSGNTRVLSPFSLPKYLLEDIFSSFDTKHLCGDFVSKIFRSYMHKTLATYDYEHLHPSEPINHATVHYFFCLDRVANRETIFNPYLTIQNQLFQKWFRDCYGSLLAEEINMTSQANLDLVNLKIPLASEIVTHKILINDAHLRDKQDIILIKDLSLCNLERYPELSKMLSLTKIRYPSILHLCLAIFHRNLNLNAYFQHFFLLKRKAGSSFSVLFLSTTEPTFKYRNVELIYKKIESIFPIFFRVHGHPYLLRRSQNKKN